MLTATDALLRHARAGRYAIGAFNVYNLEGVRAVVSAAESEGCPVLLQLHPAALKHGGSPLVALCRAAAEQASVPVAVHLDHSATEGEIRAGMEAGVTSVMADGSHLSYEENVAFTRAMTALAHTCGVPVEGELGRLSGTEDGLTIPEYEARLTSPEQAVDFVRRTQVDALAVCIGNVHGHYRGEPRLDFERLAELAREVDVPLVLHGASGLPEALVRQAIALGICKFNVNTELREAYLSALRSRLTGSETPDLTALMVDAVAAMRNIVIRKLRLFGSTGSI